MTLVVVHGAESVGKTNLGRELAAAYGAMFLPEFGRTWCEIFGTDCTVDDLIEIGENQQRNIEHALADREFVISDTDSLMTAAWSRMMLGETPPQLLGARKADLYLHCVPDVPFVDDGLRVFGNPADRAKFDSIARKVLAETGVPVVEISGDWHSRRVKAVSAIDALLRQTQPSEGFDRAETDR
jgi:nicotinamide riboside kinase